MSYKNKKTETEPVGAAQKIQVTQHQATKNKMIKNHKKRKNRKMQQNYQEIKDDPWESQRSQDTMNSEGARLT